MSLPDEPDSFDPTEPPRLPTHDLFLAQALDVAIAWGWIDAIRKPMDELSYLQRYVPRTPKMR